MLCSWSSILSHIWWYRGWSWMLCSTCFMYWKIAMHCLFLNSLYIKEDRCLCVYWSKLYPAQKLSNAVVFTWPPIVETVSQHLKGAGRASVVFKETFTELQTYQDNTYLVYLNISGAVQQWRYTSIVKAALDYLQNLMIPLRSGIGCYASKFLGAGNQVLLDHVSSWGRMSDVRRRSLWRTKALYRFFTSYDTVSAIVTAFECRVQHWWTHALMCIYKLSRKK